MSLEADTVPIKAVINPPLGPFMPPSSPPLREVPDYRPKPEIPIIDVPLLPDMDPTTPTWDVPRVPFTGSLLQTTETDSGTIVYVKDDRGDKGAPGNPNYPGAHQEDRQGREEMDRAWNDTIDRRAWEHGARVGEGDNDPAYNRR